MTNKNSKETTEQGKSYKRKILGSILFVIGIYIFVYFVSARAQIIEVITNLYLNTSKQPRFLNCFQRFFHNRNPKTDGRVGYTNLHLIVKYFFNLSN